MGKLSYRSYWTYVLLSLLVKYDGEWSIQDLSSMTGIRVEDVISTLQALDLIKYWKGQHIVYVAPKVLAQQLSEHRVPRLCDESKLTWGPPAKASPSAQLQQQEQQELPEQPQPQQPRLDGDQFAVGSDDTKE